MVRPNPVAREKAYEQILERRADNLNGGRVEGVVASAISDGIEFRDQIEGKLAFKDIGETLALLHNFLGAFGGRFLPWEKKQDLCRRFDETPLPRPLLADFEGIERALITDSRIDLILSLKTPNRIQFPTGTSMESIDCRDSKCVHDTMEGFWRYEPRQPVMVGLSAAALVEDETYVFSRSLEVFGGLHEVLAIGRRYNAEKRRCEILVRNSWGTACKGQKYGSRIECENGTGNAWVPANLLEAAAGTLAMVRKR